MNRDTMRQHPLDTPKRKADWKFIGGVAAAVGVAVAIFALTVSYFTSIRTVESCTVDSKERTTVVSGGGGDNDVTSSQKKIVYTDCGVFTVDDNFLLLRFSSADTYGSLSEDETFDLEVIGWRVPILSWFPNVLSATPSAE